MFTYFRNLSKYYKSKTRRPFFNLYLWMNYRRNIKEIRKSGLDKFYTKPECSM